MLKFGLFRITALWVTQVVMVVRYYSAVLFLFAPKPCSMRYMSLLWPVRISAPIFTRALILKAITPLREIGAGHARLEGYLVFLSDLLIQTLEFPLFNFLQRSSYIFYMYHIIARPLH